MAVNLFDANFYRSVNPDLAALTDEQTAEHLQVFGLNEGRRFSAYIDLDLYRDSNPDLAAAGLTTNRQLFDHLQTFGVIEPRLFSPVFDANFYRSSNADLLAASLDNEQLLEHFQIFGINEGRAASETFDVSFYLENNADLRQAGFSNQQALEHYLLFGIEERRFAAPGTLAGGALDIGVLAGDRSFNGFVEPFRGDSYRFILNGPSKVSLSLEGTANLNLTHDINGNNIKDNSGTEVPFIPGGVTILPSDESLWPYTTIRTEAPVEIESILPAGNYFISVFNLLANGNYTLSLAATPSSLPPDNAGNTLTGALDIGVLQENRAFSDFVGLGDRNDIYRFSLDAPATVNLAIEGLKAGTILMLVDDDGDGNGDGGILTSAVPGQIDEVVASLTGENVTSGTISQNLLAGTYFVRVASEDDANYNLGLSATPFTLPPDNAGNSISAARNLDVLSTAQTISDAIGFIDPTDFYRFTLENPSQVTLGLSGLSGQPELLAPFTSLELIEDINGDSEVTLDSIPREIINQITDSTDSITQGLSAGTYFLRVVNRGRETIAEYNLTVAAVPFTPPQDDAGNSPSEAREVDILTGSQTFEDFVGGADRQDVYRFNLESDSDVSLVLEGANLDDASEFTSLILTQDSNGNGTLELDEAIAVGTANSSSIGTIDETLAAGIYFVEVVAIVGDTNYSLTLSA